MAMAIAAMAQSKHQDIPFELQHDYLVVVKGSVGQLGNLSFVIDTGTTHTMLDRRIADKLSLARHPGKVLNFGRHVDIEWAEIAEWQVGPLKTGNLRVMVGDLKQFSQFADAVDAIIGLDVLRMSRGMRIDYGSRLVSFKFEAESVSARIPVSQAFLVRLPVQGQSMLLIVDSGYRGILLYTDRLRRHLPQLKLTEVIPHVHQGNMTGETATLSGLHVGAVDLQASVFLIPDVPDSIPVDIDGYLGTAALNAKWVELDFATNTLRLAMNSFAICRGGRFGDAAPPPAKQR